MFVVFSGSNRNASTIKASHVSMHIYDTSGEPNPALFWHGKILVYFALFLLGCSSFINGDFDIFLHGKNCYDVNRNV